MDFEFFESLKVPAGLFQKLTICGDQTLRLLGFD